MNQFQFQRGLAMPEFFEHYVTDEKVKPRWSRPDRRKAFAVLTAEKANSVSFLAGAERRSSATPVIIKPR